MLITASNLSALSVAIGGIAVPRTIIDPGATAGLLDRAVDLLDVHGWCQGKFVDDSGRLCLEGALRRPGRAARSDVVTAALLADIGVAVLWAAAAVGGSLASRRGTARAFGWAAGCQAIAAVLAVLTAAANTAAGGTSRLIAAGIWLACAASACYVTRMMLRAHDSVDQAPAAAGAERLTAAVEFRPAPEPAPAPPAPTGPARRWISLRGEGRRPTT